MERVVKDQEAKRLRIKDLLTAQVPIKTICEIVQVSSRTVQRVRQRLEAGNDLKHVSSPFKQKKLTLKRKSSRSNKKVHPQKKSSRLNSELFANLQPFQDKYLVLKQLFESYSHCKAFSNVHLIFYTIS